MSGPHPVARLFAPAKVNLHLAVGARRSDGYHNLVTVFQALEFGDGVEVTPADALRITCNPDIGVMTDDNLVAHAARNLADSFGREPAFGIDIRKRIPAGGGLAGGSSDAAAALLGIAMLWNAEVPSAAHADTDDCEPAISDALLGRTARGTGSDVAFFLTGGAALFAGRGDRLVRRIESPVFDIVLVNPGSPVSTAASYAAFDRLLLPPSPPPDALIAALESGDVELIAANLVNNMIEGSIGLVPEVGEALASVADAPGVLGASMAGSGSTVYGICSDAAAAQAVVERAAARGWWAVATRTSQQGVRLLDVQDSADEGTTP